MGVGVFMGLVVLGIFVVLMIIGCWKWLWMEWLIMVDYKRFGVMYIIVVLIMLLCGFVDVIMMCM